MMVALYRLRLTTDRLERGAALALAPGFNRAIYVAAGSVSVRAGEAAAGLAHNSVWHGAVSASVRAGRDGARLLRWELMSAEKPAPLAEGEGIDSRLTLESEFALDPHIPHLMRCDRVDMPAGSVRHLHVQAGPGIRCLQSGAFHFECLGVARDVAPGEAWYERGPDPVFAAASKTEPTHFIRVLILPRSYQGKPSSRTVNPADDAIAQPRTGEFFIDEPIDLPE
jgi:hypothetical protein